MEDIEAEACSHCGAETPLADLMHYGEDSDFCPKCAKEWTDHVAACEHVWQTDDVFDEWGDPARYCDKCMCLMTLTDVDEG